jgi:hypothetical protein
MEAASLTWLKRPECKNTNREAEGVLCHGVQCLARPYAAAIPVSEAEFEREIQLIEDELTSQAL